MFLGKFEHVSTFHYETVKVSNCENKCIGSGMERTSTNYSVTFCFGITYKAPPLIINIFIIIVNYGRNVVYLNRGRWFHSVLSNNCLYLNGMCQSFDRATSEQMWVTSKF